MATVTVITEREHDPEHPGWHDCTYCSGMECLEYAGFNKWPLGYTAAEREALESSDDRKDETGATQADLDTAVQRRYGIHMHKATWSSKDELRKLLLIPDRAYALSGTNSLLPDHYRRFDPSFTGGHCIAFITSGTETLRILDPEAEQGYEGEDISLDQVLAWAWSPFEAMYMEKDELAAPITARIIEYPALRKIHCSPPEAGKSPKAIYGYRFPSHDAVRSLAIGAGDTSWFHASGEAFVKGWNPNDPNDEYHYFVAADGYFGPKNNGGDALFVPLSYMLEADPLPQAADAAALAKANADLLAAKNALAAAEDEVKKAQAAATASAESLSALTKRFNTLHDAVRNFLAARDALGKVLS